MRRTYRQVAALLLVAVTATPCLASLTENEINSEIAQRVRDHRQTQKAYLKQYLLPRLQKDLRSYLADDPRVLVPRLTRAAALAKVVEDQKIIWILAKLNAPETVSNRDRTPPS
ncbi:MAG: hypothetical protein ACK5VW_00745, partial [Holosporales bacterium]